MAKQRIGFVGLGLMGSEMARNLISEGFPLIGFDIDASKVEAIMQAGGKGITAPENLAAQSDLILLSLPNSDVVDQVVKKSLKLFETGRKGLILIDLTTADPFLSEKLAADLREKGIEMLDATLLGGPGMFAAKAVTVMVGGEEPVFRSCEPIFSALSKNVRYVGTHGKGALMKLMVNLVGGLDRMVLAEAITLCRKAGISQELFLEVLRGSPLYSKAMEAKGVRMLKRHFLPPDGKLAFHLKDVRLILELGRRFHCPLPLSGLHAQALTAEVAKGRGEWDNTAILAFYEDLANL